MKNQIVADMIRKLTTNSLILAAVNDALAINKPGIKFTSLVRDQLPKMTGGDDGFCFDETPESIAMDEIIKCQNIIDGATSGELNVISVDQI